MDRRIDFLNEVEGFPCLYANRRILARAIRRYEEIWLPLVAKAGVEPSTDHFLCMASGVGP